MSLSRLDLGKRVTTYFADRGQRDLRCADTKTFLRQVISNSGRVTCLVCICHMLNISLNIHPWHDFASSFDIPTTGNPRG